jgi:TRAP-type C4-dicarboxylate transport system permease small subunit
MSINGEPKPGGSIVQLFLIMERISIALAVFGGGLLTLLAIFITADVLGRGYGGLYSGATDEIAGYAMCLAVTWSLAYTLTIDKHVRVNLLLTVVPVRVARWLDWLALALLTTFAIMLAYNCWFLASESFEFNSRSPGVLQTPIGVPQAAMALGFSVLGIQGIVMLLYATVDPDGFERRRSADRESAPAQFDI